MLGGWFNTRELDAFADELIADLAKRFPPSADPAQGRKQFEKLRRTFGATFQRIDSFAAAHPLNVYKKARFANRIRWGLRDAGYPAEFVRTMTQEVVAHMTLASRRKAGP
jgi:2'-5' RNA ligase